MCVYQIFVKDCKQIGNESGFRCRLLDDRCTMDDCPHGEDYWQSQCANYGYYDAQEDKADREYCEARDRRGMPFACGNKDEVLFEG